MSGANQTRIPFGDVAPTDPNGGMRPDAAIDSSFTTNGNVRVPLATVRTRLIAEDKVMASAYYDTLSILSTINPCSEFFRGPAAAVTSHVQTVTPLKTNLGRKSQ